MFYAYLRSNQAYHVIFWMPESVRWSLSFQKLEICAWIIIDLKFTMVVKYKYDHVTLID